MGRLQPTSSARADWATASSSYDGTQHVFRRIDPGPIGLALIAMGFFVGSLVARVVGLREPRWGAPPGVMIEVVVVATAFVVQVRYPASQSIFVALGYLLASSITRARVRIGATPTSGVQDATDGP